jgi:hypothetical protein
MPMTPLVVPSAPSLSAGTDGTDAGGTRFDPAAGHRGTPADAAVATPSATRSEPLGGPKVSPR